MMRSSHLAGAVLVTVLKVVVVDLTTLFLRIPSPSPTPSDAPTTIARSVARISISNDDKARIIDFSPLLILEDSIDLRGAANSGMASP